MSYQRNYWNELKNLGGIFDFDQKKIRLAEVNRKLEDPDIWKTPKKAQSLGKEKKDLEGVVLKIIHLKQVLVDSQELFAIAQEESDTRTIQVISGDV